MRERACGLARGEVSGVYGGLGEVFQAPALTIALPVTLSGDVSEPMN